MRVDYFIRQHALDILGATLIFSSKILNYTMRSTNKDSTKDVNNEEAGNVSTDAKIQETEKASNDLLTLSSKNTNDVNKKHTCLTDNVSLFVENLGTDIESVILEDSDLMSMENWKNKAQKQCNVDGNYYSSDESICSESNVTIENDIAQLDHLYYKIEENESKCSTFRTENPDV